MALQNTFYILGIICMSLALVILIFTVVLLVIIKKKVTEIADKITHTLDTVHTTATHIGDVAGTFGSAVAGTAVEKVKSLIQGKKKEE